MTPIDANTLYGTLNLLILQTVAEGSLHGLQIRRAIAALSDESLSVEEGALYPALHRLERDGFLTSEWAVSERKRRAKYYSLTAKGRRRLAKEAEGWLAHVKAVGRVLRFAPEDLT